MKRSRPTRNNSSNEARGSRKPDTRLFNHNSCVAADPQRGNSFFDAFSNVRHSKKRNNSFAASRFQLLEAVASCVHLCPISRRRSSSNPAISLICHRKTSRSIFVQFEKLTRGEAAPRARCSLFGRVGCCRRDDGRQVIPKGWQWQRENRPIGRHLRCAIASSGGRVSNHLHVEFSRRPICELQGLTGQERRI